MRLRFYSICSAVLLCLGTHGLLHAFAGDPSVRRVKFLAIGAGTMSATVCSLMAELEPDWSIEVFERLDSIAAESSDTWNNAGTGHAGLCEMNYTPRRPDGTIDISKAAHANEAFEISKQYWAYLVRRGYIERASDFIHSVPHLSWVRGHDDVAFLRDRFEALKASPLFEGMQFSQSPEVLRDWMPIMMRGRSPGDAMAATRSALGTDIDFGRLTRLMFHDLVKRHGAQIHLGRGVRGMSRNPDGSFRVEVEDRVTGALSFVEAENVFAGAGGGTLQLLQKTGITEADAYGGFPVSGQFLVIENEKLASELNGKVYGLAPVGSPPMSVPHLDTRTVNGKKVLIFGPFAGATMKFLKEGSFFDLLHALSPGNIGVYVRAALQQGHLFKYLFQQTTQTDEERLRALQEFLPTAQLEDARLVTAGIRVQILKKIPNRREVMHFGTEAFVAGRVAAVFGASPGASAAVEIALDILHRLFPEESRSIRWRTRLSEMVTSYGQSLAHDPELLRSVRKASHATLGLDMGFCGQKLATPAAGTGTNERQR